MANFFGRTDRSTEKNNGCVFIVDTSGSMQGAKIGAVNSAIEEVLPEIARFRMKMLMLR